MQSPCGDFETPVMQVTCGSVIKLQHIKTKGVLHSHDITYGSGSGQQSVTGSFELVDANSYWQIHSEQVFPVKKFLIWMLRSQ